MLEYLREKYYPQCSTASALSGGSGGFVYRAGTNDVEAPSVVVKHAEGYAARAPQWKLDTNRMVTYSTCNCSSVC